MRLAHPQLRLPRGDTGVTRSRLITGTPLVADDEPAYVGRGGTGIDTVLTRVVTCGSISS